MSLSSLGFVNKNRGGKKVMPMGDYRRILDRKLTNQPIRARVLSQPYNNVSVILDIVL